ncbi:hypothetical protein AMS68_005713 [Peltaster fructicola]|uniref:Oxidoreductase n=1 Tax=Peltaster fructicola TaxID=286661 RepID=A0A6H0XZT8_9PEZI|nr:hypothetical protein AMS68_005713 [Peltaster fructicola]
MSSSPFNPSTDIPSLAERVILITGGGSSMVRLSGNADTLIGTAGLGAGSVVELAEHHPAHIIFSGRRQAKADELIARINKHVPDVKLTFIPCDISSFESVRRGAEAIQKLTDRLDVVMLNAGVMAVGPALSADGYETQFATNHLGHALLVQLLVPLLQRTAQLPRTDVRVINMTSVAFDQAPTGGIDFQHLKTTQSGLGGFGSSIAKWRRYGQSKLARLLYTDELAKHHPEITFVSIHPGIIMTDLFQNVDIMTKLPVLIKFFGRTTPVEQGHWNQCWAATCDKSRLTNGAFYEPIGKAGKRNTSYSRDEELSRKLWEWTQKEIASKT